VHGERWVPVNTARALAVSISEQNEPAIPGQPLTYIVSFANGGTSAIADVVLQAAVPFGTQFVSSSPDGAAQDGIVTWGLGTIAVGQSGERSFVVTPLGDQPGAIFTAAELSNALAGLRVRAETAAPLELVALAGLDVTLTPSLAAPGGAIHYDFTVQNNSQVTVNSATLQDFTLDGTMVVSANGGTCNVFSCGAGTIVTWNLGSLAPGTSTMRALDMKILGTAPGGTMVFNTVHASGSNAPLVHVDRSVRVCTVGVCEPAPPTPTPTSTPTCAPGEPDADGDGICDRGDNCPYVVNPGQEDTGGIGASSGPDGIGDACQCGDVNCNGLVSIADSVIVLRSLLSPPTATQACPQLCDVGGSIGCTLADAVIMLRANLSPPTASVLQHCPPAQPIATPTP
jgi:uncharacterized repeat protein (TIGR01451 family)